MQTKDMCHIVVEQCHVTCSTQCHTSEIHLFISPFMLQVILYHFFYYNVID